MAAGAPHHLTAAHAADLLGVTRATLYAYASRGQLRSEAVPGRPRERRYARDDVQRLLDRKAAGNLATVAGPLRQRVETSTSCDGLG
jgi:excisionase family DNA binding protein